MTNDSGLQHNYFVSGIPSPADAMLKRAKQEGHVPSTCLQGGYMVLARVGLREDPCARCEGPREKCGGRPKVAEQNAGPDYSGAPRERVQYPENMIERATNTTPEVRREQRRVTQFTLNKIVQDAQAEKAARQEKEE